MRVPFALGTALVALAVAVPISESPAAASTSCWRTAISDWSADGTLGGHYPAACLRQAMQNAPTDLKIYSTLEDDFQAALRVRSTARHLAGAHVAVASLDEPNRTSPLSPLVVVLAGLAIVVTGGAAVATIVRRRRSAKPS